MPPRRSSPTGYAATNASIKYNYVGLGFDGGCPTSQRGGIERRWVRGARIGAGSHKEKFVCALDNQSGDGWGNLTGESLRGAQAGAPLRCLTPYAITLDKSKSEPQLHTFPRVKGQRQGEQPTEATRWEPSHGTWAQSQQLSNASLSMRRSPSPSRDELAWAERQAECSREAASGVAAAVRQAIWLRNRQRPCVPDARGRATRSPALVQPWSGSSTVVDPLWLALQRSGASRGSNRTGPRSGSETSKRPSSRPESRPTLQELSTGMFEGADGVAKVLELAMCDVTTHLVPMMNRVMTAEQLLALNNTAFAEVGLKPPERRRLLALLKDMSQGADGGSIKGTGGGDKLMRMRQNRDKKSGKKSAKQCGGPKEAWRRPKKTMDHAYYEAMKLLDGDSDVMRREQVQELNTRSASLELTRGMCLALGVREIDLRNGATIGADRKVVDRLNGTTRGTAAANSPDGKKVQKKSWNTLLA